MSVNKVIYNNTTLIDLTTDTVTSDTLLEGKTAHSNSGNVITGSLSFQKFYAGSGEPISSVGSDGDLYLVLEE